MTCSAVGTSRVVVDEASPHIRCTLSDHARTALAHASWPSRTASRYCSWAEVEDDSLVLIRCSLDRTHRVEIVGRRDALIGGPRGRAQPQALVPEQAAALRRRRERRMLAATLARSSVACVVWAGVVSMTPPGRVAATPALLAVVPLDRHSPARDDARTALGSCLLS